MAKGRTNDNRIEDMTRAVMLQLTTSLANRQIEQKLGLSNGTLCRWERDTKYQKLKSELAEEIKAKVVTSEMQGRFAQLVAKSQDAVLEILEHCTDPRVKAETARDILKMEASKAILGVSEAGGQTTDIAVMIKLMTEESKKPEPAAESFEIPYTCMEPPAEE